MQTNDAVRVAEAIFLRAGRVTETDKCEAFVGVLRQLAEEAKIEEIAEACAVYFGFGWVTRKVVENRLAAIILNQYMLRIGQVEVTRFLEWSVENEDWAERIRAHASSPALGSVIEDMRVSIRDC